MRFQDMLTMKSWLEAVSNSRMIQAAVNHEEEEEALEGWPCNRESFSEFNRLSRNFQHSLSLLSSLGM